MTLPRFFPLALLCYLPNAHASGQEHLLYIFFAAILFHLMAFLYFLWISKGRRLLAGLAFLALDTALWTWAMTTRDVSAELVGAVLLALPVIAVLGRSWHA